MKRLQGPVLTVQRMVTCTYHLNPPAAISICGWRCQARQYCVYANGLPCLFHVRAPLFTLQLKLLHPSVNFWVTNYKNALQQVLCKLGSIYYLYSSKYFGKYWFRSHVYLISSKKLKETNCFSKEDSLIKKSVWHRCFPVNFAKFLRTPFFTKHLRRLLLKNTDF